MEASLKATRKPPTRVPHCPAFAETLSDYRHEKTQSVTGLLESYERLGTLLKRRGCTCAKYDIGVPGLISDDRGAMTVPSVIPSSQICITVNLNTRTIRFSE